MQKSTEAGKLIKQFAYNKNITVLELSKRCRVSYSYLCKMMTGLRDISDTVFNRLCGTLRLNRDERNLLKEAVYISNNKIVVITKDKRLYYLKFLYLINSKAYNLTKEQIDKCTTIVNNNEGRQE